MITTPDQQLRVLDSSAAFPGDPSLQTTTYYECPTSSANDIEVVETEFHEIGDDIIDDESKLFLTSARTYQQSHLDHEEEQQHQSGCCTCKSGQNKKSSGKNEISCIIYIVPVEINIVNLYPNG